MLELATRTTSAAAELERLLGAGAADDRTWDELRRFEAVALPAVWETWEFDSITEPNQFWALAHFSHGGAEKLNQERLEQAAGLIRGALGEETGDCAASFYLHPFFWQQECHRRNVSYQRRHAEVALLLRLAETCCARTPPPDWTERLARRLLVCAAAHSPGGEPQAGQCVAALLGRPEAAGLLDALTLGDAEELARQLGRLARRPVPLAPAGLLAQLQQGIHGSGVDLLRRLHRGGRLDAGRFRRALEALPSCFRQVNGLSYRAGEEDLDAAEAAFRTDLGRLLEPVLWEMLCDLRPESWPTLYQISALSGGRTLLRLVEEADQRGLAQIDSRPGQHGQIGHLLGHLLGVLRRHPGDDAQALTALLRRLRPEALLAALPAARAYEAEIGAALGWHGSAELIALLHRLEEDRPSHSDNPAVGVLRREKVCALAAALEPQQLETLLALFQGACPSAVLLVRAALGQNRREVRRMFGRRNQLAARAMGLLPLEQPGELLARYLALTRYEREAGGSPAGRKAYERAAARAGLASLAYQAGYTDLTRLEWAMEDRLGAEALALGRQWTIEGYTLTLALHDSGPAVEVRNAKRLLKRTPSAVTRDYAYREVRATLEQAEDQERRYRQAFLEAMRTGQPLAPEELALLRRNPLAVALLERLVLIDAAGAVGLFRSEDGSLEGTRGERVLLSGPVTIAHPHTLSQQGLLTDWQTEITRRQIVQPFKQIFRELYILTPAEREARYASGRLAGRRMRGRQASAVLANLGWSIEDYGSVYRPFYQHGISASFETGGYYGGDDSATTGRLVFWHLHARPGGERRVALEDVPPLIFSEVLRDLDLVTVIAHQSEERGTSQEVLRQRGDLVRALSAALGLDARVKVEEPVVHVYGKRSSYRVQLATAACYLSSGQYLCIVPSRKQQQAVYLPFAEGGETLSSEIVSKVLLLANDQTITDPTILAQIG
jgi:hypothetical protein